MKVNLETITDTLSWYKILPLKGFDLIRAKQKLLRRRKRVYESFWSRQWRPKVIYTDKSLEFGKSCEDLPWNHRTSTLRRSETNGIAERAVRKIKEGTSAVLLQSGLDEKFWAAKSPRLPGRWEKPFVKGDSENHLKDQWFHLGAMVEYHLISLARKSNIGTTCGEWRSLWRNSWQLGEVLTLQNSEMTLKPGKTSGRFKVTSFVVITVNLEFNSLCRKMKHFPLPLKNIDVTRATYRNLDVLQAKRIDVCWNVDANRSSLHWTKNLQKEICGRRGDLRSFKQLPHQIICGLKFCPACQK